MDVWWNKHWTEWRTGLQSLTAQCFERIRDPRQRRLYQRLAAVQFPAGEQPDSIVVKAYTGSGWGIDVAHMVDGLLAAANSINITTVVLTSPRNWKYAPSFSDSSKAAESATAAAAGACPTRDVFCYVLPVHNLSASSLRALEPAPEPIRFLHKWRGFDSTPTAVHLLEFMTRSQTWLRREGASLASEAEPAVATSSLPASSLGAAAAPAPPPPAPSCVVFHVRRGDVVLHGKFSRRYHAVSEYVAAYRSYQTDQQQWLPYDPLGWLSPRRPLLPDLRKILLVTDDANAIVEATTLHSAYEWRYINRSRFAGPEGGWENPIPSSNATFEVIVLQALAQLMRWQARNCNIPVLVHSKSNLADYLYAHLLMDNAEAVRIDLDRAERRSVHSFDNVKSVKLSRTIW
jgi:hypothetical protein